MKMQLELGEMTERDKKLLSIVAFLAVLALVGGFVVRPLAQSNQSIAESIEQAQMQRDSCEQKLQLLDTTRTLSDSLNAQYDAKKESFYERMESQQIDRMVTGMILSYGLQARNLTISMPAEPTQVPMYLSDGQESSQTETAACVYAASVVASMTGSSEALQQLIDDIYADYPAMRIIGYSWGTSNVLGTQPDGTTTLTLDMEIYMIEA